MGWNSCWASVGWAELRYSSLGSPVSSVTAGGNPNKEGMSGALTGTNCVSSSALGGAFTSTLPVIAETIKEDFSSY